MLSVNSIIAFLIIFCGYITFSLFLQYVFYVLRATSVKSWKIQENKNAHHLRTMWGFPLFSTKPDRGPYHAILITFNLFMASSFAALTTECSLRGWNKMSSLPQPIYLILAQTLLAITYQSIAEYYWHRIMHWKYFYKYFHKFHHYYKSPEPFDDMYIHPLEAFGYYCILYAPPFLFPMHWIGFVLYMMVMGICGVTDHSGIKLEIPLLYNTVDHDTHHAKFEVNYSFPFPFMDIVHGTFDGVYAGRTFTVLQRKQQQE